MNELSHKSGSMYELTHGYEILFMPPKVIILSHAMSYHLEKRCTHVMMYFYAMIFTFRVKLEPKQDPFYRHDICQKFYTTGVFGAKILPKKVRKSRQ